MWSRCSSVPALSLRRLDLLSAGPSTKIRAFVSLSSLRGSIAFRSRPLYSFFSTSASSSSSPSQDMAPKSQTVSTSDRLASLRSLMRSETNNVDVIVIPSEDQHASEYLAACDERRAFISGFTGSAGIFRMHMVTSRRELILECRMCDRQSEGSTFVHGWEVFLASQSAVRRVSISRSLPSSFLIL